MNLQGLLMVSMLFFLGLSSQAQSKQISKCGLPEFHEDTLKPIKTLDLSRMKAVEISALPLLTRQQIIISARELVRQGFDITDPVTDTLSAIRALKESSEGQDVFISDFSMNGIQVTFVEYFPGGNQYGIYFRHGTKTIIAFNGDGTITCK